MTAILIVDDDRAMVGMVAALLGGEGYDLITAYDGETALRRHGAEAPISSSSTGGCRGSPARTSAGVSGSPRTRRSSC